ncbi:MAG: alpha-L-fucosidase [Gemmatimonadaceae bacterium]|nr:alpha-L-fucosidase [Gemmatimonadaceae bacterium]
MHRRDLLAAATAAAGGLFPGRARLDGWWRAAVGGPSATAADRMAWWREARFGMFVHFGLYALLEGAYRGRTDFGEWIRNNAQIPIDEYEPLMARFAPRRFDADAIVRMAAAAGQRYLVLTTKHHDGFCLWPTRETGWSMRGTPLQRDLLREVADACRAHGVRPCWYHSIMDWHHPDYLPRREWEAAQRPPTGAEFSRYVAFLHRQVEELLTGYGEIGVMWFDGEWEATWTAELGQALLEHVHRLQPDCLVNSRVAPQPPLPAGAPMSRPTYGDFGTPEQQVPDTGVPGVDWESCITMNHNWGFNRADRDFKSVGALVGLLVETASKGGNLLLNIGPDGDGAVPDASVERLDGLAAWMRVHATAIHGTEASPFTGTPFKATRKGRTLHCFLADWPAARTVLLPGVHDIPVRAAMLGRAEALPTRLVDAGLVVTLPAERSDPVCSVLAVEMPAAVPPAFGTRAGR